MSDQVIAVAGAARPSSVRWKIFFLMLFLVSVNYIDRASLSVAMPLISKEFDIDPAWQGLILSSFFWTYAFMQVPGGMLADRFKPRIVIALATVFLGRVPGDRRARNQLVRLAVDPARPGRFGSADLSGGRQTQRHLDDADRTRAWRDAARWRRAAWVPRSARS